MTTPAIERLGDVTGSGDDIFEERDDQYGEGGNEEDAGAERAKSAVDPTAPIPGGGKILEMKDPAKLFKLCDREVEMQERLAKNRDEEGKHWDRIKRGVQFSILEKSEDQSIYRAILPPGVDDQQQPIPNKVLDLANKQVSQILVDPPLPNPKPDGDSEKSRGAMDLAKRFLRADGDSSGTDDMEIFRRSLTLNRTRKSAFVFQWVDKTGGGWRPKQKNAHPHATDARNPLMGPVVGPDGAPAVDPATGKPQLERSADPVLRYIGEDENGNEEFADNASAAAREWLPKHRALVLHPNQVRTMPPTATATEANSIVILMWEPLSEAKKRFEVLRDLSSSQLKQLAEWRPRRWKAIVPEAMRPKKDGVDASGEVSDQTIIFWYHKFCRISPDYPDGAELAISGASLGGRGERGGFVLVRDTLREDVELDDGSIVPVLMEPPVSQFMSIFDVEGGDPQGLAPVSTFGGANEIRAHLYLAVLEDIDVRLHINTFLTSSSGVTKEDLNRRDGTPIDVVSKDDMPIFEQRPPLPPHIVPMLERVDHDMDTLANLNQTAQALDSNYSQSGEAKKVAIRQAKVQLAQDYQGFVNGATQFWKHKLQLAQARLKTPQLVKIGGENSAYKARHFVGADLIGVSTVTFAPGSGTMMSPAEKAQYIAQFQGQKWLSEAEAGELARSSMSDDLGLNPSAHEEHIDRCISDWIGGPPPGWDEAYAAFQSFPQKQQEYTATLQRAVAVLTSGGGDPQQAQQLAQEQVGQPPVQPPEPPTPFEPRANDEEPVVAKVRYEKLSKLMSTVEFSKQSKTWRTCVDKAYQQALFAAGIVTVRQQQAMQQQQAQAAAGSDDKNAPPEWGEFLAQIRKQVVTAAAAEVAKVIKGVDGIGAQPEQAAPEAPAPDSTHLELLHQTMENERDRQHEIKMADRAASHAQSATVLGKTLDHASNQAHHAAGAPRPERPS